MEIKIGTFIEVFDGKKGVIVDCCSGCGNDSLINNGFCNVWLGDFDENGNPIVRLFRISRDFSNVEKLTHYP